MYTNEIFSETEHQEIAKLMEINACRSRLNYSNMSSPEEMFALAELEDAVVAVQETFEQLRNADCNHEISVDLDEIAESERDEECWAYRSLVSDDTWRLVHAHRYFCAAKDIINSGKDLPANLLEAYDDVCIAVNIFNNALIQLEDAILSRKK